MTLWFRWLATQEMNYGALMAHTFGWMKCFYVSQMALVSSSWHSALTETLDSDGDPAAFLFLWAKRTHRQGLLSVRRRNELPSGLQYPNLSDEQFGNCAQVAVSMCRWRSFILHRHRQAPRPSISFEYWPLFRIAVGTVTVNEGMRYLFQCIWKKADLHNGNNFFKLHRACSHPRVDSRPHALQSCGPRGALMASIRSDPLLDVISLL